MNINLIKFELLIYTYEINAQVRYFIMLPFFLF
jgi:hypothetical protein